MISFFVKNSLKLIENHLKPTQERSLAIQEGGEKAFSLVT